MRDLFKVTKDNKILDQILKKQQRRGYRTFADPTIWKSKEEIISGQGNVSVNKFLTNRRLGIIIMNQKYCHVNL